jgi:hypothetical protein
MILQSNHGKDTVEEIISNNAITSFLDIAFAVNGVPGCFHTGVYPKIGNNLGPGTKTIHIANSGSE